MRKIILTLLVLLVISSVLLGGCSGTVDSTKSSDVLPPPSLPEDIGEAPEDSNNLQPPSLPEE